MFSLKAILMSIQVRITKVRLPDQLTWVRSFKPSASEAQSELLEANDSVSQTRK